MFITTLSSTISAFFGGKNSKDETECFTLKLTRKRKTIETQSYQKEGNNKDWSGKTKQTKKNFFKDQ